ncbi:ectoine hydroxylase [Isoalcanivorax pacificus W11-5]|uniref:Ectoine hydroxylase n=1 Tax=Isoalcanivorax pacificus W11-5 TaxID=391936 RepID=A0A0B4XL54_9GAMM|nr:phytanoyl-CoA dioxygenase family protein [Isoalcanivorax pacificus]AJD47308.1 ectoine hydroxylase [Isoalcanivorax pacificus W11-5]
MSATPTAGAPVMDDVSRPVPLDPYPSRFARAADLPAMFPRREPVVHARYQQRWDGPLDEVALSHYERDGFLWFEGFFSRERVEPFFDELLALSQDSELMDSDQVIRDPDSGELRSVFAMHELSERFDRLTRDPRILGMVRQLLGGEVYIHQSRVNDKYGFQGSGFDWHSDFETWHMEDGMPRMRAVSASLMLTDNNEFNGPLMLIPGSHQYFVPCLGTTPPHNWRRSLQAQQLGVPPQQALARLSRDGGIRAPKGPAGSLLLFECNVLHASNRNMSPWPRSNLFFVYNSIDNAPVAPYCGQPPRPRFLATRADPPAEQAVPQHHGRRTGGIKPLDMYEYFTPLGE